MKIPPTDYKQIRAQSIYRIPNNDRSKGFTYYLVCEDKRDIGLIRKLSRNLGINEPHHQISMIEWVPAQFRRRYEYVNQIAKLIRYNKGHKNMSTKIRMGIYDYMIYQRL